MVSLRVGIGIVVTALLASGARAQPSTDSNAVQRRMDMLRRMDDARRQDSLAAVAPLEALRSASWFEAAQVGIAGQTPAIVRAWQSVARGRAPAVVFASLLRSDSAAARLYALAGLYSFDRRAFKRAAAREQSRTDSVMTLIGCAAAEEPVATMVAEIATGSWSRDFRTGKLGSQYRSSCSHS
jgi:hypothetical protein